MHPKLRPLLWLLIAVGCLSVASCRPKRDSKRGDASPSSGSATSGATEAPKSILERNADPDQFTSGTDTDSTIATTIGFGLTPDGKSAMLPTTSMEKPILLSITTFSGAEEGLGLGQNLSNFLIYFTLRDNTVYMFEDLVTSKKVASTTLPTEHLLADFKVVAKSSQWVSFDLVGGISQVLNSARMAGGSPFTIKSWFVNSLTSPNQRIFLDLAIDASTETESEADKANMELLTRMQFSFSPYTPKTNFVGVEPIAKARFFTTAPLKDTGTGRQFMHNFRWAPDTTIHWYLSDNIPADFVQAVKDGINYWQPLLPKNKIQIDPLPKDKALYAPGYNVVQWVDWQTMPYAYADFIGDPVNGEILQAEVYIPSTFAFNSVAEIRAHLSAISTTTARPRNPGRMRNSSSARCHSLHQPGMRRALSNMIWQETGPSDPSVKTFSQDLVRMVIAHEIGHTLGLRHNFAGNLAATHTLTDWQAMFPTYLSTGKVPLTPVTGKAGAHTGPIFTSSIMDYNPTEFDVLQGAAIRLGAEPLPYDKAAITWGYNPGTDWHTMNFGPFCTDEHKDQGILDCSVFDYPGDPLTSAYSKLTVLGNAVPNDLATRFVIAKAPQNAKDAIRVQEVVLSPEQDASGPALDFERFIGMLKSNAPLLWVPFQNSLTFVSDFNARQLEANLLVYQTAAVKKLGSADTPFQSLFELITPDPAATLTPGYPPIVAQMVDNFEKILRGPQKADWNPGFKSGTGLTGVAYTFTDDELNYIANIKTPYFTQLNERMIAWFINILLNNGPTPPSEATNQPFNVVNNPDLAIAIGNFASGVILAQNGTGISDTVGGSTVAMLQPLYSVETRLAATQLLSDALFDLKGRSGGLTAATRTALLTSLQGRLRQVTNNSAVLPEDLPDTLRPIGTSIAGLIEALNQQASP